jgi:hypothetical protein
VGLRCPAAGLGKWLNGELPKSEPGLSSDK